VQTFGEIAKWLAPITDDSHPLDADAATKLGTKPESAAHLSALVERLSAIDTWHADSIKAAVSETAKSLEIKMGALMFPLRVTATGQSQGTDLMPTLEIVGRERSIERITRRSAAIFTP
jgi:glutamyl-tRNA synthetase